jgi:hypothetical protein
MIQEITIAIVRQCFFTHASVLFVATLGHTNGYLGSLMILLVSESVRPDETQLAGPFTSSFLNLGLWCLGIDVLR